MISPFLVLGATGTPGRRVVHRLSGRGVAVRRASRRATPPVDWTARSTRAPALHGAGAAAAQGGARDAD